jgi:hypothetical protein
MITPSIGYCTCRGSLELADLLCVTLMLFLSAVLPLQAAREVLQAANQLCSANSAHCLPAESGMPVLLASIELMLTPLSSTTGSVTGKRALDSVDSDLILRSLQLVDTYLDATPLLVEAVREKERLLRWFGSLANMQGARELSCQVAVAALSLLVRHVTPGIFQQQDGAGAVTGSVGIQAVEATEVPAPMPLCIHRHIHTTQWHGPATQPWCYFIIVSCRVSSQPLLLLAPPRIFQCATASNHAVCPKTRLCIAFGQHFGSIELHFS